MSPSASPAQSPMASQPGQDESPETDERVDLGGASHALRQTELANQLSELNKVLARKQELAEGMGENHERLLAMRQQYENTLKTMEEEIHRFACYFLRSSIEYQPTNVLAFAGYRRRRTI